MRRIGQSMTLAVLALTLRPAAEATAEPFFWGIEVEQAEYRVGEDEDVAAWDFDVTAGGDELRFVWRSEAEFSLEEDVFESLENQARLQTPISDFFDAVAGIRLDTPEGPDRLYGVVGLHGLTQQWFEVDLDLFLSDRPIFRGEVEYEGLITNRITLTPSVELDLPLADDEAIGYGAFGPKVEIGARLSYDLVDRALSPYIGVHYERLFGESADLASAGGGEKDAVYFVIGSRLRF